jgi:hypothetical protein
MCDLTQDASKIKVRIYTTGYRTVKEINIPGPLDMGRVSVDVAAREFSRLAAGIYYYTVAAESSSGAGAKARPKILVIKK